MEPVVAEGLEGVIVARTRLSDVDGEQGRLTIAGHPVEQLAGSVSFEAVCHLLWRGALPSREEEASTRRSLGAARVRAFAELGPSKHLLQRSDGCATGLRGRPAPSGCQRPSDPWRRTHIGGAGRVRGGVRARAGWSHARRAAPSDRAPRTSRAWSRRAGRSASRGARRYLVTVSDRHERVDVRRALWRPRIGPLSAVVADRRSEGPLHGRAPRPVLDMLDAIGDARAPRRGSSRSSTPAAV
jgi:citrate synthase